jgi:hypothetical protein
MSCLSVACNLTWWSQGLTPVQLTGLVVLRVYLLPHTHESGLGFAPSPPFEGDPGERAAEEWPGWQRPPGS